MTLLSCIFRSFPVRASRPLFMYHRQKSPSLLASSGSHHTINPHLSSSTPNLHSPCPTFFRFFSAPTLNERESELLNKETTPGDGKGEKSDDQSKKGFYRIFIKESVIAVLVGIPLGIIPTPGYNKGVEEKNKGRFEEFKLKLLEPRLVSEIVVNHSLALVYLKNNTKVRSVFDRDQPIEKGLYLLGINSPKSFKEELEQTQKILRLEPIPVIDVTKNYSLNSRKMSGPPM